MTRNTVWRKWRKRALALALATLMVVGGISGSYIPSFAAESDGTEAASGISQDVEADAETMPETGDADTEDVVSEDVVIEDTAGEDAVIEDTAGEDAVIEDTAGEDVVIEDVITEDAVSEDTADADAEAGPEADTEAEVEAEAESEVEADEEAEADSGVEAEAEEEIEAEEEVITEEAKYGNSFTPKSYKDRVLTMGVSRISQNQHIYFGTKSSDYTWTDARPTWRVLDSQYTNDKRIKGLFLLSENLIGEKEDKDSDGNIAFQASDKYNANVYQGSDAQAWCNTFLTKTFSAREQKAIYKTTKLDEEQTADHYIDGEKKGTITYTNSWLSEDKVFFLSAEEAYNSNYFSSDADRIADYYLKSGGTTGKVWWLRSPIANMTAINPVGMTDYYVGGVTGQGHLSYERVNWKNAARPAFNINPNAVVFSSAARGGKSTGVENGETLYPVAETNFTAWELTLLDDGSANAVGSGHSSFKVTSSSFDGRTLEFKYQGATTGNNEYISAIVTNSSDTILYYGNILKVKQSSGNASIDLSGKITCTDKLYIFQEQLNGDYMTDYCSALCEVDLSVDDNIIMSLTIPYYGNWDPNGSFGNVSGSRYEITERGWYEDDGTFLTTPVKEFEGGKSYLFFAAIRPKYNRAFKQTAAGRFAGEFVHISVYTMVPSYEKVSDSSLIGKTFSSLSFSDSDYENGFYLITSADRMAIVKRVYIDRVDVFDVEVKGEPQLREGDKWTLTATVRPHNANNKACIWTSSNTGVATVDANGNVKAVKEGTAVITVKTVDGEYTDTCTVTVKRPYVTGVKLSSSTLALTTGQSQKLTATVVPANAHYWNFAWYSSNTKVATVDANGNVKAVAPGTSTITVVAEDGTAEFKRTTCTVTVKAASSGGINGFVKGPQGWGIYKNGAIDTSITDVRKNEYGWWYIQNGRVTFTFNGVAKNQYGTWFIRDSKVDFGVNGVVKAGSTWYYFQGGKVTAGPTVKQNANGWWYIDKSGKVDFGYNGLAKNEHGWWKLDGGQVKFNYNGVVRNEYGLWCVKNSKVDFSVNGLAKVRDGEWYLFNGGKVREDYTGWATNVYGTWYVKKGKVDFSVPKK